MDPLVDLMDQIELPYAALKLPDAQSRKAGSSDHQQSREKKQR